MVRAMYKGNQLVPFITVTLINKLSHLMVQNKIIAN